MAQTLQAIDISHYQPEPDFAKVKAAGIVGVIFKATQGTSYVDDTYKSREGKALAAGLKTSTYHYLEGGNITAQMDHYLSTIDAPQGARVCLDHEADATRTELEQAVSYIQSKRPDLQVTIYSGHLIKDQLGSAKSAVLATTSLWLAQYTTGTPSWPKGTWPTWSLWQFTDQATVAGISGKVDGNTFNGSNENLAKWFGPVTAPAPTPTPEPSPTGDIAIVIDTPGGFDFTVSITVNGKTKTVTV